MSSHLAPAQIKSRLDHPVVDADGHWIEYGPVFHEQLRKVGGDKAVEGFSSDIGHFDVPDMTGVLPEAYEMVEHGLAGDADFRDFTFANVVRLFGRQNSRFFEGTRVAKEAAALLASSAPAGAVAE